MLRDVERAHVAQHLGLLVADRLVVRPARRLHREVADDLQEVVLDDVADDAGLLVELPPPRDPEALGHRDLDVLDVVAVPDRLEEGVRESEVEDVLDRLLAEVVVDPEDVLLGEGAVQDLVERARRGEVAAERLLERRLGPPRRGPTASAARRPSRTCWAGWRGSGSGGARRRARCAGARRSPPRRSRRRRSGGAGPASRTPPRRRRRRARPGWPAPARRADRASSPTSPPRPRGDRGAPGAPCSAAPGRSSCRRGRRSRRRTPGRRRGGDRASCWSRSSVLSEAESTPDGRRQARLRSRSARNSSNVAQRMNRLLRISWAMVEVGVSP